MTHLRPTGAGTIAPMAMTTAEADKVLVSLAAASTAATPSRSAVERPRPVQNTVLNPSFNQSAQPLRIGVTGREGSAHAHVLRHAVVTGVSD